jgi:hypothetical protein
MITVGLREQHEFPKEYQQRLTQAGGLNRFGDPLFRGVWGWSRLDWLYSAKTRTYSLAPKYITRASRWYIEQWLPPEKYGTPATWYNLQTDKIDGLSYDLLGPYPTRGDHECLLMLETPHREGCDSVAIDQYDGCLSCRGGRFIEPTSFIVDQITRLVERSRNRSERDRMNDTKDLMENWSKDFDNEADDRIKDSQSSFNSQTVFMSGPSKSR